MISLLSKEQMKFIFDNYMIKDFPESELKPWKKIENGLLQDSYFAYGMFEDIVIHGESSNIKGNGCVDGLKAYAFFIKSNKFNTYLLDYFAVLSGKRQSGIGSAYLQELKNIAVKDNKELILEVENPYYESDLQKKENMLKRIQFYKKNHINVSNVSCNFMSNEYRILYASDKGNDEQIRELTENVYRDFFGDKLVDNEVIFHD